MKAGGCLCILRTSPFRDRRQIFFLSPRLLLYFLKSVAQVCKYFCVDLGLLTNIVSPVNESDLVYFLISKLFVLSHRVSTHVLPLESSLLWKWKSLGRVRLFATPLDYTVLGILQPRILDWIAFPFSKESSQPRNSIQASHIEANGFFTSWATKEGLSCFRSYI